MRLVHKQTVHAEIFKVDVVLVLLHVSERVELCLQQFNPLFHLLYGQLLL